MPQNEYIERFQKQHGKRLDHEERTRKRLAREAHHASSKSQNLRGLRAKLYQQKRHKEKIQMKKTIKQQEEKNVKSSEPAQPSSTPLPSYLLDRSNTTNAKALSSAIKNKRAEKAAKFAVPLPKVRGISEEEMFKVVKTGKKTAKKSWKRMITKPTFVGPDFTRRPVKYERFIRPMGLRYKKANVTHPELGVTVQLPIISVKKNPQNPMYTQLGVLTKGTIVEVNVSELGLVTAGGKVVWGRWAQITNNCENDGPYAIKAISPQRMAPTMTPPPTHSEEPKIITIYEQLIVAQDKQKAAVKHLSDILQLTTSIGTCSAQVVKATTSALQDHQNLQQALDILFAALPTAFRTSPNAARVAQKVFDIPEILEHILQFLALRDVLSAEQVNRQFFTSIERSTKIQRRLGFQADHGSCFRFSLDRRPLGFDCYTSLPAASENAKKNTLMIEIQALHSMSPLQTKPPKCITLGRKARSILLCQPPVTHIDAFTSCCCNPPSPFRGSTMQVGTPVASRDIESGVTVGDVLEMTTQLRTEHWLCPAASIHDYDKNGNVHQYIVFRAAFHAREDDPELRRLRSRRQDSDTLRGEWHELETRLVPYIAAKRTAHANGHPIPTLAEFEATLTTNED